MWRIRAIAPGLDRARWAPVLDRADWPAARVLKQDGGSRVLALELEGRPVVVKLEPRRAIASALRASRAWRHWRGARILTRLGLATAAPLVIARGRVGGLVAECLVMERLEGRTLLEIIAEPSRGLGIRAQHELARRVGRDIAAIILARRFNRDHKPSNLIVVGSSIAIIDCVAIRRDRGDGPARMLASLSIEPRGLGHPPRLALAASVVRAYAQERFPDEADAEAEFRRAWRAAAKIIRAHGPGVPRVDPLARS